MQGFCLKRDQPYRIIFFDAGGTLIERRPSSPETLTHFLEKQGILITREAAEMAWRQGTRWAQEQSERELEGEPRMAHHEFLRNVCRSALRAAAPDQPDSELWQRSEALRVFSETRRTWRAIPGAPEVLEALRCRGHRMGLISNFDPSLPAILQTEGLMDYFSPVVVSALVGIEKPDPQIIRIACKRANVHPDESLYVGDHPFDVVCAKKSGMDIVWIAPDDARLPDSVSCEPDYRMASLSELLSLPCLA